MSREQKRHLKKALAHLFDLFDSNEDGTLDPDEMISNLLGTGMEPDEISSLFEHLDVDHDGLITLEEFMAGFQRYAPGTVSPPAAARPDFLATQGTGIANVDPLCWSMSIAQWIQFVRGCIDTDTWKVFSALGSEHLGAFGHPAGDKYVNMYDVNQMFVKPWTQGTGCSVAQLMNPEGQSPVELMVSHAWGGSVIQTLAALLEATGQSDDFDEEKLEEAKLYPKDTRIFFCTFCMYQPQDDAPGGLSIGEQLEKDSFAQIIKSRPAHGMCVVHTTTFELYTRLWCVFEVHTALQVELLTQAIFSSLDWDSLCLEQAARKIDARKSNCAESDKAMLVSKIEQSGGFDPLNAAIREFREKMAQRDELLTGDMNFELGFGDPFDSIGN